MRLAMFLLTGVALFVVAFLITTWFVERLYK